MAKLHIEGANQRPELIRQYLDFIDRREYDSVDDVMQDIYRETGLDASDAKNMKTTLAKLQLVKQKDRQQLTDRGQALVDILLYKDQIFFELLHFIYATEYHRNPSPDRAISWSYYHISQEYRQRSPVNFDDVRQEVIETVMRWSEQTGNNTPQEPGPLSLGSITNYGRFVRKLDPPVIIDGEFSVRTFAPKEPVLAAIDHLYRTDLHSSTLEYGNQLMLSEEVVDTLATILLLRSDAVSDVIEHVASMDSRVRLESDRQLRVRLTEPITIHDLS